MIIQIGSFAWFLALLIAIGFTVGTYFLLRRRSERVQKIVIYVLVLVNVFQHLFKHRIWSRSPDAAFGIENTLYNVCAFLIMTSAVIYFTHGAWRDFITYVGTVAGMIAMIVPYWLLGNTLLNLGVVRFYFCHTLLFATSLLPALLGHHKVKLRNFPKIGLCFLAALVVIFVDQILSYYVFHHITDPQALYEALMKKNDVWMLYPPSEFPSLVRFITFFTPDIFLPQGDRGYTPILWYAIPLYLGITLLAYACGMLLDREGRERHIAFFRALPARVRALFKKKER